MAREVSIAGEWRVVSAAEYAHVKEILDAGSGGSSNVSSPGLMTAAAVSAAPITTAERFSSARLLLQVRSSSRWPWTMGRGEVDQCPPSPRPPPSLAVQDDDAEQAGLYKPEEEDDGSFLGGGSAAGSGGAGGAAAAPAEAAPADGAAPPGAASPTAAPAEGSAADAAGEGAGEAPSEEDEEAIAAAEAAAAAAARAAALGPRKIKPADELTLVRRFWSVACAVERVSDGVVKFGLFSVDTTAAKAALATHARQVATAVMDAIVTDCASVVKRVTSKFKHIMVHISSKVGGGWGGRRG